MGILKILEKQLFRMVENLSQILNIILRILFPEKVKAFLRNKLKRKEKIKIKKSSAFVPKIKQHLHNLSLKIISLVKMAPNMMLAVGNKLRHFSFKKFSIKALVAVIVGYLLPLVVNIKKWYLSLKPITIVSFIITGSVGGVATVHIVKSTGKIVQEVAPNPPQKQLVIKRTREDYYKNEDKQILIRNVAFPIYIGTAGTIKSLYIDFVLESSNRYTKAFFYENEHLIKDKLSNTLHPIVPEFPLTEEGKVIVRKKIKDEVNALMKQLNMKGRIKKVMFDSIISG